LSRRLIVAVAMLCAPAWAEAQIPTVPRYLGQAPYVYEGRSPIDILNQHQTSGDWNRLQAYARELLKDLAAKEDLKPLLGNIGRDYYNFIWESTNADGKAIINRVLVHRDLEPQHASRLPGLSYDAVPPAAEQLVEEAKQPLPAEPQPQTPVSGGGPYLFDLLLSTAAVASLSSVYVTTPAADPLLAQLPDVVARVNVLGFVAKAAGTGNADRAQILVYVNQALLPVPRGAVKIKDVIATRTPSIILQREVSDTFTAVVMRQARTSACAVALANALKTELDAKSKEPACTIASDSCSSSFKSAIASTYANTVAACAAEAPAAVGFDPVMAVEQEFKKLIAAAGPKQTTGESTLTNTPLTRYSFGLLTGVLIGRTSMKEPRVKIDAGRIAPAPTDRLMSMVVFNMHPKPYDAEWNRMSKEESFRVFFGTVMTPDFGLSAGLGFGLVRGLAVNVGVAAMLSDAVKGSDTIGAEPADQRDPFRTIPAMAAFAGFSYTFK
jgi:hypothetical protein